MPRDGNAVLLWAFHFCGVFEREAGPGGRCWRTRRSYSGNLLASGRSLQGAGHKIEMEWEVTTTNSIHDEKLMMNLPGLAFVVWFVIYKSLGLVGGVG